MLLQWWERLAQAKTKHAEHWYVRRAGYYVTSCSITPRCGVYFFGALAQWRAELALARLGILQTAK